MNSEFADVGSSPKRVELVQVVDVRPGIQDFAAGYAIDVCCVKHESLSVSLARDVCEHDHVLVGHRKVVGSAR